MSGPQVMNDMNANERYNDGLAAAVEDRIGENQGREIGKGAMWYRRSCERSLRDINRF